MSARIDLSEAASASEAPSGPAAKSGARTAKTPKTRPRHRVVRTKARAKYDRESIHAILDAGIIAHVGFCANGQPFVIPMLYARDGNELLLHGSVASRLVNELSAGLPACISVTIVDGLVVARSHFHHSLNNRSFVAFGIATMVEDGDAKVGALARFVDAIIPGRAAESRPPDRNELAATHVLRFTIEDASAKVRTGGVKDDAADLALPYWAGIVPQRATYGAPEADVTAASVELPRSVRQLLALEGART